MAIRCPSPISGTPAWTVSLTARPHLSFCRITSSSLIQPPTGRRPRIPLFYKPAIIPPGPRTGCLQPRHSAGGFHSGTPGRRTSRIDQRQGRSKSPLHSIARISCPETRIPLDPVSVLGGETHCANPVLIHSPLQRFMTILLVPLHPSVPPAQLPPGGDTPDAFSFA